MLESGDVVARLLFDEAAVLGNPNFEVCWVPVLENVARHDAHPGPLSAASYPASGQNHSVSIQFLAGPI